MTTFTFNNANGGYWNTAGNWSPSGVPGSGDDAVDNGLNIIVNDDQAARTLTLSGSGAELDLYGGTLSIIQTLSMSAGTVLAIYGGTLLLGGAQSTQYVATVTFSGAGTLALGQPGGDRVGNPTVLGFGDLGEIINLLGSAPGTGATAVLDGTVLDITLNPGTSNRPDVEIQLDESARGLSFVITPDGSGGSLIQVACFCRGTRIATPDGEVPVEELRPGQKVRTAEGTAEPVLWLGRRSYGGRFLRGAPRLHPVRIAAGALGDGLPRRDLLVSPDHAMLLDGVLVPAGDLVDGNRITRERAVSHVDYFHVELARHAILLAEGAATESFIDHDSAGLFHNAHERPGRHGQSVEECAPRVRSGFRLDAIRRRLSRSGPRSGPGCGGVRRAPA